MSEDPEIAQAIALSLLSQDQENEDLREALAASLGKSVDQLTARDLLLGGSSQGTKRKEPTIAKTAKRVDLGPTKYWDGVVKFTWVPGFTGTRYVTLAEVVQKSDLKKALVTAFVYSIDFINHHFPSDVNVVLVAHGRPAIAVQLAKNRVMIQPKMKDATYGVFHNKLMLLFHSNSLRVVIGSANMVPYDYEEMENVLFIQDFPKLDTPFKSTEELLEFAQDLVDVLEEMCVPLSVIEELLYYDFSKAKAYLVASVSGVHEGKERYQKYGHTRLASVVRRITGPLQEKEYPRVEMQTSSLGALTVGYLQELYQSFCGVTMDGDRKGCLNLKKGQIPPIDIVYPSKDTVDDSRHGAPGASTICLNTPNWQRPTFPREVMCDAISHRQGSLMHTKYIIATLPQSKTELKGWVYLGSHNATAAAWGKFTIARESKEPKMSLSNWELGVVLPLYEDSDLPAPYLRPPPRYSQGQQAWTQAMD